MHLINRNIFIDFCLLLFCLLFVSVSCSKKPVSIQSGQHQCHHCKMLISDLRFHAQKINKNGKHYHYDSIECMVWDSLKNDLHVEDVLYVRDILQKNYIEAPRAFYLLSSALPSPMGANVSAYSSQAVLTQALQKYPGQDLSFTEMMEYAKTVRTHTKKK